MAESLKKLQATDLFLVNRTDTYTINFTDLSEDIAIQINNVGSISVDNLGGIKTDRYVKSRDTNRYPVLTDDVSTFLGTDSAIGVAGKEGAAWLLQYITTGINGGDAGSFVLADPQTVFGQIAEDALTSIQLDTLQDVFTKDSAGDYLDHVVGDSFLLCSGTVQIEGVEAPKYQVANLSQAVDDLLNNGSLEISIEHIAEFHTNVYPPNTPDPGDPGGNPLYVRLVVTEEYKKGTSTIKYEIERVGDYLHAEDDDILVYIQNPPGMIVDASTGNNGTALKAGWYVANTVSEDGSAGGAGGGFFKDSQRADMSDADIAGAGGSIVGLPANLGVVRVVPNKGTTFAEDTVNGGQVIGVDGTDGPTNVNIDENGVLYVDIPNTLSFVETILVRGTQISPTFWVDGGTKQLHITGPGAKLTPEESTTQPDTGDFYVLVYDSTYTGTTTDVIPVGWNTATPVSAKPDGAGPLLNAKNGDIVAFGEEYWNIIGSANTDSIRQDLDSVLSEGKTSDRGISLTAVNTVQNAGLIVGNPTDSQDTPVPGADGGEVACEELKASNIDFSMFKDISEA